MNLAIIGATGNVGRKTIEILENSKIKIDKLFLVASKKSAGKKIKFKNKNLSVIPLEKFDFSKAKISFFAAGSQIAKKWVKKATSKSYLMLNPLFLEGNLIFFCCKSIFEMRKISKRFLYYIFKIISQNIFKKL